MNPIATEKSQRNFAAPVGQEHQIGDLPGYFDDREGYQYYVSVWEPTEAERSAIAAGLNIELGVGWIGALPPISLGVTGDTAFAEHALPSDASP